MSSPPPHMSFEGLLADSATHILSSPIQSSFPHYNPMSPYNTLRKTPSDSRIRSRMRSGDGFLVSPLTRVSSSLSRVLGSGSINNTPTISFMAHRGGNETPVTIADPNSAPDWNSMDLAGLGGLPTDGLDMSAFEDHALAYGSPFKAQLHTARSVTPTPMTLRDVTPVQSPVMQSAPPTMKKGRTVSGLGTPTGAHRSAKRIRQATYDVNSMPISPSAIRRRTDPASSLTTSMPLSRAVSTGSYLTAPHFVQDRMVSNSSVMTTSTSYESIPSPNMAMYGQEYQMMASTSLPELIGSHSQQPSPNLSFGGRSPLATPQQPTAVFYTSPEHEQGAFGGLEIQGDMNLMGQVSQVMSMPNSSAMASVASFPGQQAYRQGTLSTIVETPLIAQEQMQYQQMPSQPDLSSHTQFQPLEYPPVPGMNMGYSQTQSMDISAWSAQTYANQPSLQYFGYAGQPQMPPGPQRHASASFLHYQPSADQVRVFPSVPRSFSAPYIPTMSNMPSMSNMPPALSSGGIFGPGSGSSQAESSHMAMEQYDSSRAPLPPYGHGVLSSPDTPKKRQTFPQVGKRLRPGPKPKAKTPKKGKTDSSPEPGQGTLDPSILAGSSSMSNIDEEAPLDEDADDDLPPSPKPALVFSPDLSSMKPPSRPSSQPQLVINPPRTTVMIDGQPASGLPRTFLERLYTTFLTLDGSMTGQPVKRFKCLIEGCERHFPRKSAIHSHIQTHLEDKPFICNAEDW